MPDPMSSDGDNRSTRKSGCPSRVVILSKSFGFLTLGSVSRNRNRARLRRGAAAARQRRSLRSEEHTSELQSLMGISYAVFCLNTQTHQNKDYIGSTINIHTSDNNKLPCTLHLHNKK